MLHTHTYILYQPIFGPHSGDKPVAYEALTRNQHIVNPSHVVNPLRQASALAHLEMVIESARGALSHTDIPLHINVSPETLLVGSKLLKEEKNIKLVLELLEEYDFDPYMKLIEHIGLPVFIDDIDRNAHWLHLLNNHVVVGAKTSVSFYKNTLIDNPSLIKSLVQFFESQGMAFVVEGVESRAMADEIFDAGGYAQGFALGKPVVL